MVEDKGTRVENAEDISCLLRYERSQLRENQAH